MPDKNSSLGFSLWRCLAALCFLALATMSVATTTQAQAPAPANELPARIKVLITKSVEVPFEEDVLSAAMASPELAALELKSSRTVKLTGLAFGETMMIVSTRSGRRVFAVEITGLPAHELARPFAVAPQERREASLISGLYSVSYTSAPGGGPATLRHKISLQRKVTENYSLSLDGDLFNSLGRGQNYRVPTTAGFATDYLSVGLRGQGRSLELLDSSLNISPIHFNGYAIRGAHLTEPLTSPLRGLEVFGGIARPQYALFGEGEGKVAGFLVPIVSSGPWRIRTGAIIVSPRREKLNESTFARGEGGTVWLTQGQFAAGARASAESEVAYANGGISWRGRIDLRSRALKFYGEAFSLDRRSPLISIGAQPGARHGRAFAIQWQPSARLIGSVSYNGAASARSGNTRRVTISNAVLTGSVSFFLSPDSRVGVQFTTQRLDTNSSTVPARFQLESRSLAVSYDARFARRWSNSFEARRTQSHDARAGAQIERGFSFREELRHSWRQWSASGFLNYTHSTPSLASLLIRNPSLLPSALRAEYTADPVRFLAENRDRLPSLLAGVALPNTDNTQMGMRLQGILSRYSVASEVRYGKGSIEGRGRRSLLTLVSATMRLDESNSLALNLARSFTLDGTRSASTLNISYTHRFGGSGFNLGRLFGAGRGRIQGRVFSDLNGNGKDEANEPGVAGAKVQMDTGRIAVTGEDGTFRFSSSPGTHTVKLVAADLGVHQRASTPTEQQTQVSSRQLVSLSFGLSDLGFVAGRVFNDTLLAGENAAGNNPGVRGVRLRLRRLGTVAGGSELIQTTDNSGTYEFRNLAPGSYVLEIEASSLPPDFRQPARTSWPITVGALEAHYLDIPLAAHRAASGIAFLDRDGDGQFDPEKDEAIEGVRVTAGASEVMTGPGGSYFLRNLLAGKLTITACLPSGGCSEAISIELAADPTIRRGVNLAVRP